MNFYKKNNEHRFSDSFNDFGRAYVKRNLAASNAIKPIFTTMEIASPKEKPIE